MRTIVLPQWIWVTCLCTVCAMALWRGGWSERIGAVIIFLGWPATVLALHHRWNEPQTMVFIVDALILLGLTSLSLWTDRFWPIWAAGFQLLAVITHAARMIDRTMGAWAYITAGVIWGYLLVFALAFGTWGAWRERRDRMA